MSDADRDFDNLVDYCMRATSQQLAMLTLTLAHELVLRGVSNAEGLFEVARNLRRSTSTPRAEPLSRPA